MEKPIPQQSLPASAATTAPSRTRQMLKKVPEVTLLFWIIKLLTTAFGESFSDFLFRTFQSELVIALAIGIVLFLVSLILQLSVRRYIAWIYWFAVAMVAVFGTMAADVAHYGLDVPFDIATAFFAGLLVILFVIWYLCEKTLSLRSIVTRRRELFYWSVVISTFALGTAVGDLAAYTLGLGFFPSTLLFLALFLLPALGYWKLRMNASLLFWLAYTVTRPLGASFADWMGKSTLGGLGLGDGWVGLALSLAIIGCVWYLTATRKDRKKSQTTQPVHSN